LPPSAVVNWNVFQSELLDRRHHPRNGAIVLAQVENIGRQPVKADFLNFHRRSFVALVRLPRRAKRLARSTDFTPL
jgi:hypothetical protein